MPLLDLPIELLEPIIHEVVRSLGTERVWELRAVCTTFARLIYEDVLGRQGKKVLNPAHTFDRKLIAKHKTFVLCRRGAQLLDCAPYLPRRVNAMNDWMCDTLKEEGDNDTNRYISVVCDIVTSKLDEEQFLRYLYPGFDRLRYCYRFDRRRYQYQGLDRLLSRDIRHDTVTPPISSANKLAIAVCLPEHLGKKLIQPSPTSPSLLSDINLAPPNDQASKSVFGDALYNAVLTHLSDVRNGTAIPGSSWALDMLEQYLRSAKIDPSSNYVNIVHHVQHSFTAPPMSPRKILLTYGTAPNVWSRTSARKTAPVRGTAQNALYLSMGLVDKVAPSLEVVQRLFNLFDEHCKLPNKAFYDKWLECAIRSGNKDLVRLTLARPCPTPSRVTINHFNLACSTNAEVVGELLRAPGLSANAYYQTTSPLLMALRSGKAEVVRVVLEAGANVNARRRKIAPLQVALRKRDVLKVKLLLDHDVKFMSIAKKRELEVINRYKQIMAVASIAPVGGSNNMMSAESLEDLAMRVLGDLFTY